MRLLSYIELIIYKWMFLVISPTCGENRFNFSSDGVYITNTFGLDRFGDRIVVKNCFIWELKSDLEGEWVSYLFVVFVYQACLAVIDALKIYQWNFIIVFFFNYVLSKKIVIFE